MVSSRWMIGGCVAAGVFVACGGSIENSASSDRPQESASSSPSSPPSSDPSYSPTSPFSPSGSLPPECKGSCFKGGTAVCAADWALAPGKCDEGWECCEPKRGAPAPTPTPNTSLFCSDDWDSPYPPSGTCFGSPCPAASVCESTQANSNGDGETGPACKPIGKSGDQRPPTGTCFIANCGTIHCKGSCTDPMNGVCN
jgi:hypothetical protein